jgi:O-acetylserine/cysteine efflux transporter
VPDPERLPTRDLLLVLAVVALWGFNFVPIRWALDEVPPLALASLRFLLAAVPLVFLVKRPAAPAWSVVAYGLAIGVGQFGLLFLGIAVGMPAGLASLVAQAQVFLTIGLAAWLLRDRVAPRQALGALVAASGLALLVGAKLASGARATALGLALCLLAALSWAIGNVVAKHAARARAADAPPLDMFALVVWSSLVAPVPLAVLSFLFEGGLAPLHAIASMSPRAWASTLFMAWGATLFGFAAWNRLLHRHPTGRIAPFALLIPIAGLTSAWLVLGEALSWLDAGAGALVLAGLALTVL